MRHVALAVALLVKSNIALAACAVSPLERDLQSARTIFIATITSAELDTHTKDLVERGRYKIRYRFTVKNIIKGDPAEVSSLVSTTYYDDPVTSPFLDFAEQTRLVPGDNVLVVSETIGDAPISSIGCTPSRPWDNHTKELTDLLPGFSS